MGCAPSLSNNQSAMKTVTDNTKATEKNTEVKKNEGKTIKEVADVRKNSKLK